MDRGTVYFGQLARETDLLSAQQFGMVGNAKLAAGVLGTSTIVNGFTCTPTSPASLNVLLTAGEIYQIENLEATSWSSLSADTAHSILKQGIQLDPVTFGITPPGTVGFSQVFLIEVQYADLDTGSTVLPYFNVANPLVPFSGPGNAGTAQNTVRKGIVASQVKAGIAAATGTQTTPTADAGWTGLFAVTVANGAVTITSGNIVKLTSAPFLATNGYLPQIPTGVQQGTWTYAADTSGASNTITVALSPALPSYGVGTQLVVKLANNITGATVININQLGNVGVVHYDGSALSLGDGSAGQLMGLVHDGSHFQIAWKSGNGDIIDSAVTFTVHGGGANFTDLNAAMEYLGKFKITRNGKVTLQLAGASSGTATQFTYSSMVYCDHPNNDRILILGATMLGSVPTAITSYASNGYASHVADIATNLAMLRTKFATELHFTGGTGIEVNGLMLGGLDAILFTGDGTVGGGNIPDGQGVAFSGCADTTTRVYNSPVNGLAAVGFGGYGFTSINGSSIAFNTPMISIGNTINGFAANCSSYFGNTGGTVCLQNGSDGINTSQATIQYALVWSESNNGSGVGAFQSRYSQTSGGLRKNATFGLALNESQVQSIADYGTGGTANGTAPLNANDGSIVNVAASINTTGSSPAVGTVGNNNSLITTT